jgi:hypothetical protein
MILKIAKKKLVKNVELDLNWTKTIIFASRFVTLNARLAIMEFVKSAMMDLESTSKANARAMSLLLMV